MGCRSELLWFQTTVAERFEIKLRAKPGESRDCDKSITISSRVLKLQPWGLEYEPDPRHAEPLTQALSDAKTNPVSTPGVRDGEDPAQELIEDADAMGHLQLLDNANDEPNGLAPPLPPMQLATKNAKVPFSYIVEACPAVAYSEIYGTHPRHIGATRAGYFNPASQRADPFTGGSPSVMRRRYADRCKDFTEDSNNNTNNNPRLAQETT